MPAQLGDNARMTLTRTPAMADRRSEAVKHALCCQGLTVMALVPSLRGAEAVVA